MIKIKSITDVITNSSNETFIIKGKGELYSFDQIRKGYTGGIDRDDWVLLIQEFLHIPLKDNPLPLVNYRGNYISYEYGYVSGPYDHDYEDYYDWVSENDDLRADSIMSAGRDMGFWDSCHYGLPNAE